LLLAPVEVRERVAFSPNELSNALKQFNSIQGIEACVILSSLNQDSNGLNALMLFNT
jgi:glutamyl-tRNA reductase